MKVSSPNTASYRWHKKERALDGVSKVYEREDSQDNVSTRQNSNKKERDKIGAGVTSLATFIPLEDF